MNDTDGWQRIEQWLRAVVPFALTLLLTLISALPLGIHGLGPVMPVLPAISGEILTRMVAGRAAPSCRKHRPENHGWPQRLSFHS